VPRSAGFVGGWMASFELASIVVSRAQRRVFCCAQGGERRALTDPDDGYLAARPGDGGYVRNRTARKQRAAVGSLVMSASYRSDVIGDNVTKSTLTPTATGCLYCRLGFHDTNHANAGECIDALQREIARLREQLRNASQHSLAVRVQRSLTRRGNDREGVPATSTTTLARWE
jgi:hypothetical protein